MVVVGWFIGPEFMIEERRLFMNRVSRILYKESCFDSVEMDMMFKEKRLQ